MADNSIRVDKITETPLSRICSWLANIVFTISWHWLKRFNDHQHCYNLSWRKHHCLYHDPSNSWDISLENTNVILMVSQCQGIAKVIKDVIGVQNVMAVHPTAVSIFQPGQKVADRPTLPSSHTTWHPRIM